MTAVGKERLASSLRGAWVSIITYITLTAAKLGLGYLAGSQALMADGLNNATDVLGSVAVLCGLRIALQPADEEHRYGHERAEGVASVVVATIMGLVGLNVGFSAVKAIFQPDLTPPSVWSMWVGLVSAGIMYLVYRYNMGLAKRTGSRSLEAAAFDNRSDALTSLGTVVGIVGAQIGWAWIDPLAGLAVAILICHTAWEIGREAAHMLMDGFDDPGRMAALRTQVAEVNGVTEVQRLRARHLGLGLSVDVTVAVACDLSVVEAHEVADRVEAALKADDDVAEVHVHVEPD